MRGVSEVIAIILILMITISLAGLAYMFMSTTMSDVTASAGSTVDATTSSMLVSFRIESMDSNVLYVRNTGQSTLSSLSVYVNDISSSFNMTPATISPGAVASVAIIGSLREGDTVKVTSETGFSASKAAPSQCYGAVACWRFDEGSGTVAYDSSGTSNGNLTNGPVWARGIHGNSLVFDGVNDYVRIGNDMSLPTGSSARTMAFWAKAAGVSTSYKCMGGWGPTSLPGCTDNYRKIFSIYQSNSNVWRLITYCSDQSFGGQIIPGSWYFVTLVYEMNSPNVSSYLNGYFVSSLSLGSPLNTSDNFMTIGKSPYENTYWNGTIDDVMVWDRALSAGEIAMLYSKAAY